MTSSDFSHLEPVLQQSLDEFYAKGRSAFGFQTMARGRTTGDITSHEIYALLLNPGDYKLVASFLKLLSFPQGKVWFLEQLEKQMKEIDDSSD
jgi:hypothetical protein